MLKLLSILVVGAVLMLCGIAQRDAFTLRQHPALDLASSASNLAVRIKFGCSRIEGKLVCGKDKDQAKELPKPAPVEQPCPAGMVGKQPNCECADGTYLVAFVGCVPVIPTAPAPSAPAPSGPKKHYCVTCGGPGCVPDPPACPSGGKTSCVMIGGKTYYNCCCN